MRKLTHYMILGMLLFLAGSAIGDVTLEYFRAESKYDNVTLEWKSNTESGISYYVIQRKAIGTEYVEVARVTAKGNNAEYTYIDASAYKEADVLYTYRLGYNNSLSYSKEIQVSHNVSNVKRTWGSIKDMFR